MKLQRKPSRRGPAGTSPSAEPAPPETVPRPRGRPRIPCTAEHVRRVFELALLGLTDDELAEALGISERTLENWKLRHPEFLEALKRGKSLADAEVAHSLYRRA